MIDVEFNYYYWIKTIDNGIPVELEDIEKRNPTWSYEATRIRLQYAIQFEQNK